MNSTFFVNQLAGVIRTVGPVLTYWLVSRNLPADLAGTITGVAVETIIGIVTIASAYWSWRSNRPVAVAAQTASDIGVKVIVQQNASPEMKQLAADPAQPDIETVSKIVSGKDHE